ncbi:transglycosylase SLT domain-containing protein [Actinophytocola sp. NPDC049390]|uniref:transglycosylase SLT domain-containing protein n=1 Tax=Actinophytocola sp. NPDC049390 TaxID=3363894 RepID=UPI0037A4DC0C
MPGTRAVAGLVAAACVMAGCSVPEAEQPVESSPTSVAAQSATPVPSTTASRTGVNQDPAEFADPVVEHAGAAEVNPVLLMAILYNESYKPHDPELERAWQKIDPDAAFGVANMHRAAFDDTRRGRPFADRRWEELPDDPDLAIEAAAWYLHDLAARLPVAQRPPLRHDDLLAIGYNAGPGAMSAVANGAAPGTQAQSYVEKLRRNWAKAEDAVRR